MKASVAYLVAILLHAAVIFGLAMSKPVQTTPVPKKKYIEVMLSTEPPAPLPSSASPLLQLPSPPPEPPPPPPSPEPPVLPKPKVENTLPELEPEQPPQPSPPALPLAAPTLPALTDSPKTQTEATTASVLPVPGQYLNISQPSFLSRIEPEYSPQSRRQHQQGAVLLGLYINELGSLDKVEVVKSSGYPVLDQAAVDAMRQSRFRPAYQDKTPVPSHAEVTITFRLQ